MVDGQALRDRSRAVHHPATGHKRRRALIADMTDLEFADEGRRTLVVVGNGMVGHELLEVLVDRGATAEWDIVTFCEESRPAYDRVGLSSFFNGTSAEELSLVAPGFFSQHGLTVHLGDAVASIDRA